MNVLSEYANEEFDKFIRNKRLQESLNDLIVFYQLSSIDEIVKLCLDI